MAMALFHEIMTEVNHSFSYGGGFEVACLDQNAKIAKVPITFVFWKIFEGSIELVGPILAFNYPTSRQLAISRLHRASSSGEWQLSQFIVNDVIDSFVPVEGRFAPDFDTFFAVHYLIPQGAEGSVKLLVKKGMNKGIKISAASEDSAFEVEFSDAFVREVQDVINC